MFSIDELKERYQIDFKWRDAWRRLAEKGGKYGLCSEQEYADIRAWRANMRIKNLMIRYDDLVKERESQKCLVSMSHQTK